MSKRRYERILDKVREFVEIEKKTNGSYYPMLRPWDIAEKLGVKESVVNQACSVLQKEGVLSTWRGSRGTYGIKMPPRPRDSFERFREEQPHVIRKRKVSWGGAKKRLLAIIRKDKPWVVEMFYCAPDDRWFMYMDIPEDWKYADLMPGVAAEDQPQMSRTEIAKNHYDLGGALQKCAALRRKYKDRTFRIRDTNAGDYVLGAIL
jgi:hypothetical protein